MDGNTSKEESDSIDWSINDKIKTYNLPLLFNSSLIIPDGEASIALGKWESSMVEHEGTQPCINCIIQKDQKAFLCSLFVP